MGKVSNVVYLINSSSQREKTDKHHNNETVAKYINRKYILHHFHIQNLEHYLPHHLQFLLQSSMPKCMFILTIGLDRMISSDPKGVSMLYLFHINP